MPSGGPDLLGANRPEYSVGPEALGIVEGVSRELDVFSYYDLHALSKMVGIPAPKTADVITRLREDGYGASFTHFAGTGVRTDAGVDSVRSAISRPS